jgi:DNA-binding response OmpR family regulator
MFNVLVIDDEKTITDALKRALTRIGHNVETADTGEEGVSLFDNNQFDLVITDIAMPHFSGYEVSRHIRRSTRPYIPPIIGISGTPWLSKEDDFDLMLPKPFTLKNLFDAIGSVMCSDLERVNISG